MIIILSLILLIEHIAKRRSLPLPPTLHTKISQSGRQCQAKKGKSLVLLETIRYNNYIYFIDIYWYHPVLYIFYSDKISSLNTPQTENITSSKYTKIHWWNRSELSSSIIYSLYLVHVFIAPWQYIHDDWRSHTPWDIFEHIGTWFWSSN